MYEPTGRQLPHLAFLWPAVAAASASEIAASIAKQFVDLAVGRRTTNRAARADMGDAQHDRARIEDGAAARFQHRSRTACRLCCARLLRCTAPPLPIWRPGIAWSWHCAPPGWAAVRDRLALGRRPTCAFSPSTTISPTSTCWSTSRRRRRSDRALPGRLDVAALRRAVSRQGAQAGAGRRAHRHRRRPSGLSALTDASPLALFHELVKLGDGRVLGRRC